MIPVFSIESPDRLPIRPVAWDLATMVASTHPITSIPSLPCFSNAST